MVKIQNRSRVMLRMRVWGSVAIYIYIYIERERERSIGKIGFKLKRLGPGGVGKQVTYLRLLVLYLRTSTG